MSEMAHGEKTGRLDRRNMVYIATFGALWGLAESTLGSLLHLMHIPFSGLVLGSIGLAIVLIARSLNPRRGSTFLMSIIAASVKMLGFSTVKLGPFVAIVIEGLTLELILTIAGTGILAYMLSALFISLYPILQSILTKSILFGQSFVPVVLELVEGISKRLGYNAGWWALGLYFAIHLLIGGLAAFFSWTLAKRLKKDTAQQ